MRKGEAAGTQNKSLLYKVPRISQSELATILGISDVKRPDLAGL